MPFKVKRQRKVWTDEELGCAFKRENICGGLTRWEQSESPLLLYCSVLKGRHNTEKIGWCQGERRGVGRMRGCQRRKGFGGSGTTGRSLRPHNAGFLTMLEGLNCVDIQRGSSVQWHDRAGEHRRKSTYQCQAMLTFFFLCSIAA